MKRTIALLVAATLVMGMMAAPASAVTIVTTTLKLRVSDRTPEFRTEVTFTSRRCPRDRRRASRAGP